MSTTEETREGFYLSEEGEWVPVGWECKYWEDEISLNYGKAIKGYKDKNSGYPVYGTNGHIGYHEEKLFDGPAVILGRKGANRGVEFSNSDFWVVDTAYGVEPKNENEPRWLYYKLIADKIGEIDDGSPIPSTPRAFVYATHVNLPEPPEQRAIAAVLGSLDDKIELLREQNETLEALAQTLFKRWFIDFNFPDVNGKPYKDSGGKMITSELGEIPEGWRVGKLGEVYRLLSGYAFKSSDFDSRGEYMLVTIANVQDGAFIGKTKDRLLTIPPKAPDYVNLKTGDVLISLTGNVGRTCRVVGEDYLLNQRVAKIVENNPKDRGMAYGFFRQPTIIPMLEKIASGTAQQNLSPVKTEDHNIVIPYETVRAAFSGTILPLLAKIDRNTHQIQTLTELRDTLLPKLMKGEIRVSQKNA